MNEQATLGLKPARGTHGERTHPLVAFEQADLASLRPYMLLLMMRNITSNGFLFEHPDNRGPCLQGSVGVDALRASRPFVVAADSSAR